jgi:hypothetical protein
MVTIRVEEANKKLKDAFKPLTGEQVPVAITRAINRTLQKGRTTVKRNVKANFNVKEIDFVNALTVWQANKNKLQGYINASAKPISLSHFDPKFITTSGGSTVQLSLKRQKNKTTGKQDFIKKQKKIKGDISTGVSFTIAKGQTKTLPFAFMLKGDNAKPVFARGGYSGNKFIVRHQRVNKSGSDTPIAKLITTSIFGSTRNDAVQKANMVDITADYEKRLVHEINFLTRKIK